MSFEKPKPAQIEKSQEKELILQRIEKIKDLWSVLQKHWEDSGVADPLAEISSEVTQAEELFKSEIVKMLACSPEEAEVLYEEARRIKADTIGEPIHLRAAIYVTNVCRQNCRCCTMRSDNLKEGTVERKRMNKDEIVEAIVQAREGGGIKDIFIQGGEDVEIISTVIEAVKKAKEDYHDIDITLSFGNLSQEQYKEIYDAGVRKYVIKIETANSRIHEELRSRTIQDRINYMVSAKEAGLAIGSGNIIGLPGQTDDDLASDLIFLGRFGVDEMISSTTYTPSEVLPEPYNRQPAGDWEKTKRFIALLRYLFPKAYIEVPSNVDGQGIIRKNQEILGQTELIMAGANDMLVEFTPQEMAKSYGATATPENRHVVNMEVAQRVVAEVEKLSK